MVIVSITISRVTELHYEHTFAVTTDVKKVILNDKTYNFNIGDIILTVIFWYYKNSSISIIVALDIVCSR